MSSICELQEWLKDYRKVVVLGIGNSLRQDDAIGLKIARRLRGKVPKNVEIVDCESVPENFLDKIARSQPTHILMIDATTLNSELGTSRLILPNKISDFAISTHRIPLNLLVDFLKKTTAAKVILLGIQPRNVDLGQQLTPGLERAAEKIAKVIVEAFQQLRSNANTAQKHKNS